MRNFLLPVTLLTTTLITPTFAADSVLSRKFILDTEKNGRVTVEYKQITHDDGSMVRDSRYLDGGKLLSEIHEKFSPSGAILELKNTDHVCGREDSVHREGDRIVGTYRNGWGEKVESYNEQVPPGVTFGSGILNTMNNSLDILRSGGKVDLKFFVPEKTDWFTLRIVGWDDVMFNGTPAKKITIEPVSFFLKLFVKGSYYIVNPTTQTPLAFSGTFSPLSSDCRPMAGMLRFSQVKKKS